MARQTAPAARPRAAGKATEKSAAKPLPRRSPPASRPTTAPGLGPLLAALLALIEAHRASATEGPAAVVLRVLGEVAALALRFSAAPGAWRLQEGTLDNGPVGAFAGLSLVAPAPPAPAPSPAPVVIDEPTGEQERDFLLRELRELLAGFTDEKPARPEAAPLVGALRALVASGGKPPAPAPGPRPLGELHAVLAASALAIFEQLGELGAALDGADVEVRRMMDPKGKGTPENIRNELEEARDCLRFAACSLGELGAALTGENASASPASHAAALARVEMLAGREKGRRTWAETHRQRSIEAFTDW